MDEQVFKGYNGNLLLTATGISFQRGVKGVLLGGGMLRGDKTIPYSSITAIQLKKAGMTAGYIQITLSGGGEAKGGLFQATRDENSIMFYANRNKDFEEAKRLIEERIATSRQGGAPMQSTNLDELEKLASLKEKGIITQKEFDQKKKQLLDL